VVNGVHCHNNWFIVLFGSVKLADFTTYN